MAFLCFTHQTLFLLLCTRQESLWFSEKSRDSWHFECRQFCQFQSKSFYSMSMPSIIAEALNAIIHAGLTDLQSFPELVRRALLRLRECGITPTASSPISASNHVSRSEGNIAPPEVSRPPRNRASSAGINRDVADVPPRTRQVRRQIDMTSRNISVADSESSIAQSNNTGPLPGKRKRWDGIWCQ